MAYIGLADYDPGGRVRTLEGMGEVTYDTGRTRNLLGAELGAVKYDDGGRFRSLVGLGQDEFAMDFPTDLPLAPVSSDVPLMFEPPTPSPTFDTASAPITGTLVDTTQSAAPRFYTPLAIADTVSTPVAGKLVDTTPAAVAPPVQTASVLTSIFNGVRNIFSSTASTVKPATPGTVVGTVAPAGSVGASWFSQSSVVSGLPNWGLLAGLGVGGILLMSAMRSSGGGGSRKKNPRRRNGAELILMGANPSRRRWAH